MIPILYEASLADAWSVTNGIGRLQDCISCYVTEERNGEYTLEMEYPLNGIHAEDIATQRIIKARTNDKSDLQCFRIVQITPNMTTMTVHANHVSYDLSFYPVRPFSGTVLRPADALTLIWYNAVNQNPFLVDPELYELSASVSFGTDVPISTRSMLGGHQGSVLDVFGGEYEWDNRKVIWKRERGTDSGVTIRYGKNLMSIEQELNIAETVCGILPFYSMDGNTVYGSIQYSDNASAFPFLKTEVKDFTEQYAETVPTVAQLEARAASYIRSNNIGVPVVSTEIEFFPLWQTPEYSEFKDLERVSLCDTVTVFFPRLQVQTKAKVVKTEYNVLLERYEKITLGTIRKNLADTVADVIDATSEGGTYSSGGGSDVTGVKGNAETTYRTGDVNLTPANIGAVPTSRTVNNKALSANISLTASDVGAVPTSRQVNGKALSTNVTLDASDVGAVDKTGDSMTGALNVGNDTYADRVNIRSTDDGRGNIRIYRADGTMAANIYASSGGAEIDLLDASATTRAALYINTTNGGILNLKDMQGNSTTLNRTQLAALLAML